MPSANRTMRFNHISFPSLDVNATAAFFERHLGCTVSPMGTSSVVKRHDFDIVIEDAAGRRVDWPENFHIGFELPTVQDVARLFQEFTDAGVHMTTGLIKPVRGSRFFCEIPGGVLVEINTREDAANEYRASFGLAATN
jgi:catechol 2,3-dioxygenase-like lactoylglutathione lyase family enzyme